MELLFLSPVVIACRPFYYRHGSQAPRLYEVLLLVEPDPVASATNATS